MSRFSAWFGGLLGLLCLGAMPAPAAEAIDLQEKTRELERIKARIQQLRGQLDSVESDRQVQNTALSENEKQIGRIARRLRVVEQSLERQRRRLAELERERADARLKLDRQRQLMARQLQAAYVTGRQEKLKILLNQQDPTVVSRAMVYYDYLNAARFEQMALLQQQLQKLAGIEQEIGVEEQRLQQLQAKAERDKRRLESVQKERLRIIAELNLKLKTQAQELANLQADERQLQTLLNELQEALADIPLTPATHDSITSRKGKLSWPTEGRLAATFGSNRKLSRLPWDGVLIEAPEGREVRSVHYGRVAYADWLRGFGLLLIIDHGDGYMSLYGYNQSLFKETGEWVEAGEVIAQVGSSGGRSTPGIYFGIRHNGEPQNPKHWCRQINGTVISGL